MIKTLVILVILAWLVTFGLVLALISTLDDLCEYEKKIKRAREYCKNCYGMYANALGELKPMVNKDTLLVVLGDDNE